MEKSTLTPGLGEDQTGMERMVFFSDAVFAIAITLLSLEIRLPAVSGSSTEATLAQQLLAIWPKYTAYIISFLVIGLFWTGHHRKFRLIQRYDGNLLLLNLLLLMVIAFIPFPTSLLSEYGDRTATIFYALVMILASALTFAMWVYASYHDRLIDTRLDRRQKRREFISPLLVIGIFLLSIGLAYLDTNLAKLSWVLVFITQRRFLSSPQYRS